MRKALAIAFILTGCATSEIGQPPQVTPIDAPENRIIAAVSPERLALSQAAASRAEPLTSDGSLWRSGPSSLFGDRRASVLGDILTVVIEIDEQAEISNGTDRSRSGQEGMSVSSLFGLPESLAGRGVSLDPAVEASSTSGSSGSGSTRREEEITLRVAATVVDILPNGHLVVLGSQEVRVNYELRDLQVAGIVRPEDISRQNEITYDKIAGARIIYGGRGQITDLQQPRYGQQLLERVLPF
ncbi:flagellar L-ring protein precursor FlgH [Monaibacterium marinum]|uniref:Flagellar L-ring protein n=1 Tax=Pontivivens marinum TaxID=1690039 RepID=A0A2C9CV15_9RHOB|nr:flagellar basal body L-ring protein FlgH [Monaibacterium marinum]SOH95097.1 flagellar L-ring protein precursor FlgH [Monaibacterium marinum]